MEQEPMDIDDSEVYTFDDLINDRIKLKDSNDRFVENIVTAPTRYENKAGPFLTGIDIFSAEEKQKMEERAKRFGLDTKMSNLTEEKEDLYSSLGVNESNENDKNLRLSVLHMKGTDEMSTKDVFKYFEHYAPSSIEWINDSSCNIVWLDSITSARALKGLSKKIIHEDELSFESDNYIHINEIKIPIPPGQWRKGIDCDKSKSIFLRFATYDDKKIQNAGKQSEYYKKYGNPNFGNEHGIVSQSRKRIHKQITNKSNAKKMITDNGSIESIKNPWGDLSHTWGLNDTVEREFIAPQKEQVSNVKERLGIKVSKPIKDSTPSESDYSDENEKEDSEDESWRSRSKVLRMRMHADDEEEKIQTKRAKTSDTRMQMVPSDDLRSKLRNKRKNPVYNEGIQVVVTNRRAIKKDPSEDDSDAEEGEILETSDSERNIVEEVDEDGCKIIIIEDETDDEEEGEEDEGTDGSISGSSDISEKEVQGPKGSVVKVVPKQKPKVASTVWARLNSSNNYRESFNQRNYKRNFKQSVKGDLRSRLGNSFKGRSPLRIEVRNDKCT